MNPWDAEERISIWGRGLLAVGVLTAALTMLVAPAGAEVSRCRSTHWVGAWATAPAVSGPAYTDQTVRLVVNPHRGGSVLRLRLSNRFGTGALTIDRMTIARSRSGARVVASTVRPVTFSGRRSVTIPKGADVASDAVRLRVRAFSDVSVSIYMRGPTGASSMHAIANETASYTGRGDLSATPTGDAFGSPSQAWPLLTGVDVRDSKRVATLVAFGDSITDGFQSAIGRRPGERNTRWPDYFARRLSRADRPYSVVNTGISGNRLRLDGRVPAFGPKGISRLRPDILSIPNATTAIVLEGINDLGQPPPAPAAGVIAALREVIVRLRAAGVRALIGTLTPAGGYATFDYGSAEAESRRQTVNRWIRQSGVPDRVIDFDAAVRDPRDPTRLRPGYDSGDHLHPNARGYARMSAAVPLSVLPTPAC